jgi:uncharacterized protein YkwD
MPRTSRLLLAFLLGISAAGFEPVTRLMASPAPGPAAPGQPQEGKIHPVAASAPDIPFIDDEFQTEQQLLSLANQSRHQAGIPPLTLDAGLSRAAYEHAQSMLRAHQLSHQFQGEPSLPQRLGSSARLLLDQEGENVALDYDAEHGHEHLMLSPPHRANLLNPAYNVVGLGVVRSGDQLYIVQDFGHALPNYSSAEVKDHVAGAVQQERQQFSEAQLQRRDLRDADSAACSMAQADKLGTLPIRRLAEHATVLTYTSLHPEMLPSQANRAITSHNVHTFSVGSCYRRTETYPTGAYWIVLSLK